MAKGSTRCRAGGSSNGTCRSAATSAPRSHLTGRVIAHSGLRPAPCTVPRWRLPSTRADVRRGGPRAEATPRAQTPLTVTSSVDEPVRKSRPATNRREPWHGSAAGCTTELWEGS